MSVVIAETRRLLIRTMDVSDFDVVSELFRDGRYYSSMKDDEEFQRMFLKVSWREMTREMTYNGLIFLKDTGQFCGRVCMQHIEEPVPELGIDVLKRFQNQGIGPEAVVAFVNQYCTERHISQVKVRIQNENEHSIHVFEKLGAKYDGTFSYFSPEVLEVFRRELPGQDISELERPAVQF